MTSWIPLFEVIAVAFPLVLWYYLKIKRHRHVTRKFLVLLMSVLIFEFLKEPLWENVGFQRWAYIWHDLTWVITFGWVGLFMTMFLIVDTTFRTLPEKKKFWVYLLSIEAIVVPIESVLVTIGIRDYSPLLKSSLIGFTIPLTPVPIEAIYYIPLFASFIICFYKYINYLFNTR